MSECSHNRVIRSTKTPFGEDEERWRCADCYMTFEPSKTIAEAIASAKGRKALQSQLEELRAENDALIDENVSVANRNLAVTAELEELQGKVEQQDDVLHQIHSWCQAYPLDIFPEPTKEDWAAARDALKNTDVPLDRVSASNMRHVVTQISEMIEQALQAKGEKDE